MDGAKAEGMTFGDYMEYRQKKNAEGYCQQAKIKGALTILAGIFSYISTEEQENRVWKSINTALDFSREIGLWEDTTKCVMAYPLMAYPSRKKCYCNRNS